MLHDLQSIAPPFRQAAITRHLRRNGPAQRLRPGPTVDPRQTTTGDPCAGAG